MKPLTTIFLCALCSCTTLVHATMEQDNNKTIIRAAFDEWRAGTGGPFALLEPDAIWTITGNSVVARTYHSRDEFVGLVIKPFNARLSKPLVPTIQSLHSDGDMVIIRFSGEALALDGKPYLNTYAWFMRMKRGKIVEAIAFFDSRAFDEFWRRVKPREG